MRAQGIHVNDPDLAELVVRDYLDGVATREIQARHGITSPTIYYYLRVRGHKPDRRGIGLQAGNFGPGTKGVMQDRYSNRKLTNAQKREILAFYTLGISSGILASAYGITRAHVSYLVKKWAPGASRGISARARGLDHDLLWVQWPESAPERVTRISTLRGGLRLETPSGTVRLLRVPREEVQDERRDSD